MIQQMAKEKPFSHAQWFIQSFQLATIQTSSGDVAFQTLSRQPIQIEQPFSMPIYSMVFHFDGSTDFSQESER